MSYEYQTIKSLVSIKLNNIINDYLKTGNATLLTDAEVTLKEITHNAQNIVIGSMSSNIEHQVKELQQLLATKIRALGKLSGDPAAILRNNEQNINALILSLKKYADESKSISNDQKNAYTNILLNLSNQLTSLVNLREKVPPATHLNDKSPHYQTPVKNYWHFRY